MITYINKIFGGKNTMIGIILPYLNEAGAEGGPSLLETLGFIPMIVIFGLLMYFMLYRPQKKQQKAAEEMRNNLQIGDEISTTSGILGKIIQIKDDFLIIETGTNKTKLKIAKWAVRSINRREEDEEEDDDE